MNPAENITQYDDVQEADKTVNGNEVEQAEQAEQERKTTLAELEEAQRELDAALRVVEEVSEQYKPNNYRFINASVRHAIATMRRNAAAEKDAEATAKLRATILSYATKATDL